jgi:hypothetical protein
MCNDAELNDLYLSMDLLKEKVKHRETFLKALKEPLSIIDEETGDLQRVHPPKKSSSTTVKVTFK